MLCIAFLATRLFPFFLSFSCFGCERTAYHRSCEATRPALEQGAVVQHLSLVLFSGAVQSRALICIKDAKEKSEGSHCSPPPWHHYLVSLACVCVCVHARGHTQIACWGLGRSLRVLTKRGTALCGTVSLPGTPGRGRASLFFWPCAVDKRRGGRGGGEREGKGGPRLRRAPLASRKREDNN